MKLCQTLKQRKNIHPEGEREEQNEMQMSNQETARISAKARQTGQEHKSYLCPKPLTGGMKQI
jgi:hypothetical protein